jgi:hypothetical protein
VKSYDDEEARVAALLEDPSLRAARLLGVPGSRQVGDLQVLDVAGGDLVGRVGVEA